MGQPKLSGDQRRSIIVTAGLAVARGTDGLGSLSFEAIAKHTKNCDTLLYTSPHVVKYWFKTRDALWSAVIESDSTGELRKQANDMGFEI